MTTLPHDGNDLCPSCGEFSVLYEDTGWCLSCSKEAHPDLHLCERCNRPFHRLKAKICLACTQLEWFEKYADRIEIYMIAGLTAELAIIRVQFENRPLCLSCGDRMKYARESRYFCRKTTRCRKAARSYKWHRTYWNLSKEEAILKALSNREEAA